MNILQALALIGRDAWLRLRSNPGFVAAYSAFFGVVANALYQQTQRGDIDFSQEGLRKLAFTGGAASLIAVMHLYRQPPSWAAGKPNLAQPDGQAPEPPKG